MVRFITPVQGNNGRADLPLSPDTPPRVPAELGQFLDKPGIFQNDVAPEHHSPSTGGNLPMDLLEKIQINAAFAFRLAKFLALPPAQIPGLVATDIEERTRKVREQFIVKPAQEGQGTWMIRGQRRRPADIFPVGSGVRSGNFGQLFEPGMLQKMPEVAERILVGHEVDAQLPAVRVKLADFIAGQRAPALPDGWVLLIGERVFGIELQL